MTNTNGGVAAMQVEMICGNTGYVDTGYGLVALYKINDSEIILIDSGDGRADDMIELFDKNGLSVKAIVFTHLHIDHVTNNQPLYDRYKCDIIFYSTDVEDFVRRRDPRYPYKQFELSPTVDIAGVEMGVIHTPGHSPDHIALVTPDNVCCIGDAIISHPLLDDSKLPYIEDVERAILSMEEIRHMPYPYYVVSHRAVIPKQELSALIDENIQKELHLYDVLRLQITSPTTMDDAVTNFMLSINISASRIQQLPYMRETVKARIRTLAEAGECVIIGEEIFPANYKKKQA